MEARFALASYISSTHEVYESGTVRIRWTMAQQWTVDTGLTPTVHFTHTTVITTHNGYSKVFNKVSAAGWRVPGSVPVPDNCWLRGQYNIFKLNLIILLQQNRYIPTK